jgi:hypothetical protein
MGVHVQHGLKNLAARKSDPHIGGCNSQKLEQENNGLKNFSFRPSARRPGTAKISLFTGDAHAIFL